MQFLEEKSYFPIAFCLNKVEANYACVLEHNDAVTVYQFEKPCHPSTKFIPTLSSAAGNTRSIDVYFYNELRQRI